jgi:DNA-directed RNA polymerase alpha subunit
MNAPSGKTQLIEDAEIARLDLSVRTSNCIHNAKLVKVGQLAALTAADILRWQNAGKKTLQEIRSVLGSLGLRLSGDARPVGLIDQTLLLELSVAPPPVTPTVVPTIYLKNAAPEIQRCLIARLKNFDLSARAKNAIIQNGIVYLGELIKLRQTELGPVFSYAAFARERIRIKRGTSFYCAAPPVRWGFTNQLPSD